MFGFSARSITNVLFWVTRKKWLILSFLLSISFFYVPSPEGLLPEGHRALIIVGVALILIISESIPLPAVAILILIMEVILGVDTADGVGYRVARQRSVCVGIASRPENGFEAPLL